MVTIEGRRPNEMEEEESEERGELERRQVEGSELKDETTDKTGAFRTGVGCLLVVYATG